MAKSAKKDVSSRSAVNAAAQALRTIVFEKDDDEFVGSEDELIAKLGVSRPTLRQAAALVSQEQWLRVKRGVGGGYFARRPSGRAVAHMTAAYLQAHGSSLEEIIRSVWPIRVELARLASRNLDADSRAQLETFLAHETRASEQPFDYRSFLRAEREFGEALGRASGNRVLALFLEILYDLAAHIPREADIYANRPERVREYREKRNLLIAAILDGDEEIAVLNAARIAQRVTEWLLEGLNKGMMNGWALGSGPWQPLIG